MIDFFNRLDKYMEYRQLNDNKITVSTGVSNGLIGKARKSNGCLSGDNIAKILYVYKDLSARWLLTGEGDMLIKEADDAVKSDETVQMWKERALLAEERVRNLESVIKTLQMVVEAEALKKMKKYSEEEQEDANGAESAENIAG